MADTKISALTALTGANVTAADDVLAIVDTSVTTTKKITVAELATGMSAALTSAANVFTATQTITSTDAGSGSGPALLLYRNSASPAANDSLGAVQFRGEDSAGNTEDYAIIASQIIDPTSGSEDGRFAFQTVIAGTLANRIFIGHGLYGISTTGGDKGADTLNFTSIYQSNVKVLASETVNSVSPTSPNRTITVSIGGTTYYIHAKTTND